MYLIRVEQVFKELNYYEVWYKDQIEPFIQELLKDKTEQELKTYRVTIFEKTSGDEVVEPLKAGQDLFKALLDVQDEEDNHIQAENIIKNFNDPYTKIEKYEITTEEFNNREVYKVKVLFEYPYHLEESDWDITLQYEKFD